MVVVRKAYLGFGFKAQTSQKELKRKKKKISECSNTVVTLSERLGMLLGTAHHGLAEN